MRWFYPQIFQPTRLSRSRCPPVVGLLIHEVNVVLFLVLVSAVNKLARHSTIFIGQHMLQELVSVRKLLPVHLSLRYGVKPAKARSAKSFSAIVRL
jgi:hypothetical protein